MLTRAVGVTAHQQKNPPVATITVNHVRNPRRRSDANARWAITKRHKAVERRAMARQYDSNEIYRAR
jgi:hypothetical protein